MRHTLASLAVAALAAGALTGCSFGPAESGWQNPLGESARQDAEQEESRQARLDFAERVAVELRSTGSEVAPPEGESLETFRHVVNGVGWEWCARIYVDESRADDPAEHERMAERYGWSVQEFGVVAAFAEPELCGL